MFSLLALGLLVMLLLGMPMSLPMVPIISVVQVPVILFSSTHFDIVAFIASSNLVFVEVRKHYFLVFLLQILVLTMSISTFDLTLLRHLSNQFEYRFLIVSIMVWMVMNQFYFDQHLSALYLGVSQEIVLLRNINNTWVRYVNNYLSA